MYVLFNAHVFVTLVLFGAYSLTGVLSLLNHSPACTCTPSWLLSSAGIALPSVSLPSETSCRGGPSMVCLPKDVFILP